MAGGSKHRTVQLCRLQPASLALPGSVRFISMFSPGRGGKRIVLVVSGTAKKEKKNGSQKERRDYTHPRCSPRCGVESSQSLGGQITRDSFLLAQYTDKLNTTSRLSLALVQQPMIIDVGDKWTGCLKQKLVDRNQTKSTPTGENRPDMWIGRFPHTSSARRTATACGTLPKHVSHRTHNGATKKLKIHQGGKRPSTTTVDA